jgi:putative sporulation protein YyaC
MKMSKRYLVDQLRQMEIALLDILSNNLNLDETVIVCIGTDRSTGDCVGPLVGTILSERGFTNIVGTLKFPIHAKNLNERLEKEVNGKFKTVIAIDACLSKKNLGKIIVGNDGLKPGEGVGRDLPVVGDISILAVVNISDSEKNPLFNQAIIDNTRFYEVLKISSLIAEAISNVYKIKKVQIA